ncbi:hypothetical protein [Dokdonella sp.]|uniref:hypothetical protein n=1 Tax=Dokdonella sp. TaxID=2291710 RepID=UPI00261A82B2|nr:hypothetical protein [Dokdonella sp.]
MSCNRLFAMVLAALAITPVAVRAQTCDAPMSLFEGLPHHGTTCGQANSLPWIGTWSSPHPDYVATFTANAGLGGFFQLQTAFEAAYALLPSCDASAEPLRTGVTGPGGQEQIPLDGLTPGQYFIVITGRPESPETTCGTFQLTSFTTLPDPIYRDGFESGM